MNGIRWSVLQKIKLLRQMCPQYERPSKPSFPTETLRQQSFLSELTKKEIAKSAFTPFYQDTEFDFWFDEVQHFLFKTTQLLHYLATIDSLRLSDFPDAGDPFWHQIKSWRHKLNLLYFFIFTKWYVFFQLQISFFQY